MVGREFHLKGFVMTAFDMALKEVKSLKMESDKEECVSILIEDSLPALLNFGVEKGCFTRRMAYVFDDFITVFPYDNESTYWEEDVDLRSRLEEAMGITEEVFNKYSY